MAVMVLFASKHASINLCVKDRLGTLGMLGMLGGVPMQRNSAFAGRITGIQAKPKDARSPLSARPVRLARRRYLVGHPGGGFSYGSAETRVNSFFCKQMAMPAGRFNFRQSSKLDSRETEFEMCNGRMADRLTLVQG